MRQASSDGSHNRAIKADIDEMTTDVDSLRVNVCAKSPSDNKQLQEKARDEAFHFAKIFSLAPRHHQGRPLKSLHALQQAGVTIEFEVTLVKMNIFYKNITVRK